MPIPASTIAHVRLTVTDIAASRSFYDAVFGWDVAMELPDDADAQTREKLSFLYGGVIYSIGGGTLIGLRPVGSDRFDADRVGLDHLSFSLASRAEIDDAAAHLDSLGIAHEPVKDIDMMYILEFRDPDGVALELAAPK